LLEAAASLVPAGINVTIYRTLGDLPHFNPDLDPEQFPQVSSWIEQVRDAAGFIVSTPEYAHGLPGSLKNALDWLVGSDAFVNKPFMLLNASSRSTYAHESLVEILSTMSGIHIKGASTTVPLLGSDSADLERFIQAKYSDVIRASLDLFAAAIRNNIKEE
jgi:NAD(P)H-dependent FMN reductase